MNSSATAITGIGLITPAGDDVESNWENIVNGRPAAAEGAEGQSP